VRRGAAALDSGAGGAYDGGVTFQGDGVKIQELSREEGRKLLDEVAKHYLNMSADEFARRWDAGEFVGEERPEVMRVAMLLPLAMP